MFQNEEGPTTRRLCCNCYELGIDSTNMPISSAVIDTTDAGELLLSFAGSPKNMTIFTRSHKSPCHGKQDWLLLGLVRECLRWKNGQAIFTPSKIKSGKCGKKQEVV